MHGTKEETLSFGPWITKLLFIPKQKDKRAPASQKALPTAATSAPPASYGVSYNVAS